MSNNSVVSPIIDHSQVPGLGYRVITRPVLPPKEFFGLTNTISAEQPGDAVAVSLSVKCKPLNICTKVFKQH